MKKKNKNKNTILETLTDESIDPEEREIEVKGFLFDLIKEVAEKYDKIMTDDELFDISEDLYMIINPVYATDKILTSILEDLLRQNPISK